LMSFRRCRGFHLEPRPQNLEPRTYNRRPHHQEPGPAMIGAGSVMEGSVNHSQNWRNPDTGHHSNDAESEFARFKLFLRVKYDYVRTSNAKETVAKDRNMELKLAEYIFYTNVGNKMEHVMNAFRYYAGF